VVRAVALVATGLIAFVGAGATAAFLDLRSAIGVSDVDALLGQDRSRPPAPTAKDPEDPFAGQVLNILLMGTDLRDPENAAIAGEADVFHSDTTVLVHVSGDRTRIEAVSIPRDSLVDVPACPRPDGSETAPRHTMFNRAFTIGGGDERDITAAAACTILTVESLTGVRITDHMVVEMAGVIGVVDAIGGVTMCLPEAMHGERVDLDLPAGQQDLNGYQSINFLRARKGQGMGLELGSDLERIKRQQAFLSAAMREILSQNVITDSPRLYRLAQEVLRSISTGPDLASPTALAGLAWSLRGIDPAQIVFTSVPVVPAPSDPDNRVVWTEEADTIWERIAADEAPPGTVPATPATPTDATTPEQPTSGTTTEPGPAPAPSPSLLPGVCPA
jgi:LCP family protein required for cell wall assembly